MAMYKYEINYLGPMEDPYYPMMLGWLENHAGIEGEDWAWHSFTIKLNKDEDMVAFKLKFMPSARYYFVINKT